MGIRRVVTGHNESGKAVFASDQVIEPTTLALVPGAEFFQLWGSDDRMRYPDDGGRPNAPMYFPGPQGFRFGVFTVAPDATVFTEDLDIEAALAEMEEKLPGMAGHMEPENPGMHTTSTIDYEYIVSGRCVLELDDGATKELAAGDTVVQSGTRHAWRNPYDEPCVLVAVLIAADHSGFPTN
ncbi:cupin domain-containing protein [Acidimicrobiales bacterium]|jgi:mannose-6-phosphate isomerase-like protein (cupin superfamily)|nr:cupin domain-containing protein [bacterium]MDB2391995.1 cupin domain-containing protein [Acidimicrobiaceae bacterium]MDB9845950.1 cupin domain-containing protein [Acidimicrobiales bacterium]